MEQTNNLTIVVVEINGLCFAIVYIQGVSQLLKQNDWAQTKDLKR